MQAPVTHDALDEARKTTRSATLPGCPEAAHGDAGHDAGRALRVRLLAPVPSAALEHDGSGGYRIEPDFPGGELEGHVLGMADHGRLHRVVDHGAAGLAAPDGRDADDASSTSLLHVGDHEAREPGRGKDVGLERRLPGLVVIPGSSTPGVVDQDIDPPKGVDGPAHRRLAVGRAGNVSAKPVDLRSPRFHLGGGLGQLLPAPGPQGHVTAFIGEAQGE